MRWRALLGRIVFRIEQLLVRGFGYRLLLVAMLIALLSVLGGALVRMTEADLAGFRDAVWWAFLRLSDPGYLGEDIGVWRRIVATLLTIAGYVVFLGALVAILTQWLNATIERLQLGLSPVAMSQHVVILGWTSRTPEILNLLFRPGGRHERWLDRVGARRMRVVVLVPRVRPEIAQEIRDELGDRYRQDDIILRSGSPLQLEHLERVDAFHAAAIVMPSALIDTDEAVEQDARVFKVLLSMTAHCPEDGQLPRFVAELSDPSRIGAARAAYAGDVDLVPTDAVIGRLLAGSAREPGFSQLWLNPVRTHQPVLSVGSVREGESRVADVRDRLGNDILLGVLPADHDPADPVVLPRADTPLNPDDVLVVAKKRNLPRRGPFRRPRSDSGRILLLGWSAKAPDLIQDLAHHARRPDEIAILAEVPPAERIADLAEHGVADLPTALTQLEGSDTSPRALAKAKPDTYDVVLLLASETSANEAEADTETISIYVALRELLRARKSEPHCIVELTDPDNAMLLRGPSTEVVTGGPFVSHVLAQTVLVPSFLALQRGVLLSGTHEVHFEPPPKELDAEGFRDLVERTRDDRIVFGFRRDGTTHLAPRKPKLFPVTTDDELLVFGPRRR